MEGRPHPLNLDLTEREREVIALMCEGLTAKQIGEQMHLSFKTIETHKANIYRKADVHNAIQMVIWAVREGLVVPA
jgi:DNA-binding NarL/FixJ family response regulator